MSQIYVDHERLQQAQRDFARHHESLQSILAELEAGLAPMLGSWDGSARELYVQRKAAWDTAARDLATLLQSIAELTRSAHAGYEKLVADNVTAWS
jgi:early secretory antigenic target protein ESAT-6